MKFSDVDRKWDMTISKFLQFPRFLGEVDAAVVVVTEKGSPH
jgi:hypothetical protein